jgi:hypothetical protein
VIRVAGAIMASTLLASGAVAVSGCDDAPTAAEEVVVSATPPQRADIERGAKALVAVSPEDLGYRVVTAPARPVVRAQTDHARRTVTLFLRRDDAINRVAHDLAHEVGHVYDATRMGSAERSAYLARRGVPDAPWIGGGVSDLESGAGDFAEVFALCAAASPDFRSTLAPRPEVPCDELPIDARKLISG